MDIEWSNQLTLLIMFWSLICLCHYKITIEQDMCILFGSKRLNDKNNLQALFY